jgi:hypothetical protein
MALVDKPRDEQERQRAAGDSDPKPNALYRSWPKRSRGKDQKPRSTKGAEIEEETLPSNDLQA